LKLGAFEPEEVLFMQSVIEGGIFNYYPEPEQPDPFSPYGRFSELAARPDDAIDLGEAALIIASQEYPSLNEGYYLNRLDAMAADVGLLMAGETDPARIIGVINSYLYGTLGFKGNETDYANPRNSFLNDVIELRTGIPITLSLLYLEITKRLGLPLEGIGLPGHFIIRYRETASQTLGRFMGRETSDENNSNEEGNQILLDPFNAGAILSPEDCAEMMRQLYGRPLPMLSLYLRAINPRQFLSRMLNNLKAAYIAEKDFVRALKIEDFILILNPQEWSEVRDRGVLRYQNGQSWRAIYDLQTYLRQQPDASDAEVIRQQIRTISKEIASRN